MLLYNVPASTVEEMHCESPLVLQTEAVQALHNGFAQLWLFSPQTVINSYSTGKEGHLFITKKLQDLNIKISSCRKWLTSNHQCAQWYEMFYPLVRHFTQLLSAAMQLNERHQYTWINGQLTQVVTNVTT